MAFTIQESSLVALSLQQQQHPQVVPSVSRNVSPTEDGRNGDRLDGYDGQHPLSSPDGLSLNSHGVLDSPRSVSSPGGLLKSELNRKFKRRNAPTLNLEQVIEEKEREDGVKKIGGSGGGGGIIIENIKLDNTSASVHSNGSSWVVQSLATVNGFGQQAGLVRAEDFEKLEKLGQGTSGYVYKVKYRHSELVLAMKEIPMNFSDNSQQAQQLMREIEALHSCKSPYVVSFLGVVANDGNIAIMMEYMDLGSLEKIVKDIHGIENEITIGKIAHDVLSGMVYLYENFRIMHRDIKPQNILMNSRGQFKICDLGVSRAVLESRANTFLGTFWYMAPERINGKDYKLCSDVWSLGITLLEIILGHFPFPFTSQTAAMEAVHYVTTGPLPQLPANHFSPDCIDFIYRCLERDPTLRPEPKELLRHPFIARVASSSEAFSRWTLALINYYQQKSSYYAYQRRQQQQQP